MPVAFATEQENAKIVEIEVSDLDLREDLFSLCLPCCGPSFFDE